MASRVTNSMNLHSMATHIELWVIEKLIPWARNPRTHSDAQIAASIAEFGFNPILVDTKAGITRAMGLSTPAHLAACSTLPHTALGADSVSADGR
jgi:hypothetical protein